MTTGFGIHCVLVNNYTWSVAWIVKMFWYTSTQFRIPWSLFSHFSFHTDKYTWQTPCVAVNVLSVLLLLLVTTYTGYPSSVCRSTTTLTLPECPVSSVERRYSLSFTGASSIVSFRATWSPAQITYKYVRSLSRQEPVSWDVYKHCCNTGAKLFSIKVSVCGIEFEAAASHSGSAAAATRWTASIWGGESLQRFWWASDWTLENTHPEVNLTIILQYYCYHKCIEHTCSLPAVCTCLCILHLVLSCDHCSP